MFKKNAIMLKWVKTPSETENVVNDATKMYYNKQIIKESAKYAAVAVIGWKVLDTASEIAVTAAQAKLNK